MQNKILLFSRWQIPEEAHSSQKSKISYEIDRQPKKIPKKKVGS
jgi:hypothetical protein